MCLNFRIIKTFFQQIALQEKELDEGKKAEQIFLYIEIKDISFESKTMGISFVTMLYSILKIKRTGVYNG